MANPDGNPSSLVAKQYGNRNHEAHGLQGRDPRRYDARAAEIEEELFALPHVTPLDGPALREIATLISLIERVDKALSDGRVETGRPRRTNTPRKLLEHRRHLSKELREWLKEIGGTPRSRADWARVLAGGGLGVEIRRRAEQNANGEGA